MLIFAQNWSSIFLKKWKALVKKLDITGLMANKKYTGKITIQQNIISQNTEIIKGNSLNTFEKLVNNGAITKIAKKIASKFEKDIIANAMK